MTGSQPVNVTALIRLMAAHAGSEKHSHIAAKFALSGSKLRDWTDGRYRPSLAVLRTVARELGMTLGELMDRVTVDAPMAEAPGPPTSAPPSTDALALILRRMDQRMDRIESRLTRLEGRRTKPKARGRARAARSWQ